MGVPSFYRWLANKYPKIVVKATEERGGCIDTSSPNPNGMEFDNLYLDMNGIIHPCFHPEDSMSPPSTFDDVFSSIYAYIDRLFRIVRPRKLLFMAIDGVAPRAKLNQQRSRRFRTAKDNDIAEEEERKLRSQFEMEGKQLLPTHKSEVADSNIITPGTEFMHKLSNALQHYIHLRVNSDAGWKDIKVILSDANVPGEGEHKIMCFIRQQRNHPSYNPNTRHCLYGLDADLIMLALATHEVHFSILREDILVQEEQSSGEAGLAVSIREAERTSVLDNASQPYNVAHLFKKPYQFLHVWILREYLELDLKMGWSPEESELDIERLVDDFIFICFFTGNDFLPHMPTLQIHEGAIDLLMTVYKKEFKNLGGYIVDMSRAEDKKMGFVKLKRVEKFIILIGTYEEKIFKKRSEIRERRIKRILRDCEDQEESECFESEIVTNNEHTVLSGKLAPTSNADLTGSCQIPNGAANLEILKNTSDLRAKLKTVLHQKSDLFKADFIGTELMDKVKLGTEGWKARYYKEKFSAEKPQDIEDIKRKIVQKYTEGLLWVLLYYFSGVPSWTWFYPFHYGPFASDLQGLAHAKIKFIKGSPFKPFDQLMSVLPPRSAHALPKTYQMLMVDKSSNILDFYPNDFEIDFEGVRYKWQGICRLPFIEEDRLLNETRKLQKELEKDEAVRNTNGVDQMFVGRSSKLGSQIFSLYRKAASEEKAQFVQIDTTLSDGVGGSVLPLATFQDIGGPNPTSFEEGHVGSQEDNVLCVLYKLPDPSPHVPRLLAGVELPEKVISDRDIAETRLWHEDNGSRLGGTRFERLQNRDGNGNRNGNWNRNRRDSSSWKFTSANSSPVVFHNDSGPRWGVGRGQGQYGNYAFRGHCERPDGARTVENVGGVISYGSSVIDPALSNAHHRPFAMPTRGESSSWRSGGGSHQWENNASAAWDRDKWNATRSMNKVTISDSSQGFRPCGRGQTELNQGFRPYGRGQTEPNQGFRPYASGQSEPSQGFRPYGRGQTEPNQGFRPYASGQTEPSQGFRPHGRGHSEPSQGFRPYARGQPEPSQGFRPYGRGQTGPNQGFIPPARAQSTNTSFRPSQTGWPCENMKVEETLSYSSQSFMPYGRAQIESIQSFRPHGRAQIEPIQSFRPYGRAQIEVPRGFMPPGRVQPTNRSFGPSQSGPAYGSPRSDMPYGQWRGRGQHKDAGHGW